MNRRNFIKTVGVASAATLTGLAGCTSQNNSPPPRKSNVLEPVQIESNKLVISPAAEEDQWVQSRRDIESGGADTSGDDTNSSASSLAGLSPIGVASAAKGRGATGRGAGGYSSAPRTSNGRAWFFGGAYASTWYDDHEDEVKKHPVQIKQIGVAYIGTHEQFEEQDPGPGPVDWDETYDSPDGDIETDVGNMQVGWYRIGTNVVVDNRGKGNDKVQDLGWECVDLRIEEKDGEKQITERWKVSPRI